MFEGRRLVVGQRLEIGIARDAGFVQPGRDGRVDTANARQIVGLAGPKPGAATGGIGRQRRSRHRDMRAAQIGLQRGIAPFQLGDPIVRGFDAGVCLSTIGGMRVALAFIAPAPLRPARMARETEELAGDEQQRQHRILSGGVE